MSGNSPPGQRRGPADEGGPLNESLAAGADNTSTIPQTANVVPLRYGLSAVYVRDPNSPRRRSKRTAEQSDPAYQAWLAQQRQGGGAA